MSTGTSDPKKCVRRKETPSGRSRKRREDRVRNDAEKVKPGENGHRFDNGQREMAENVFDSVVLKVEY